MSRFIDVLQTVLPVLLVLLLGVLCRSHSLLSRENVQALKRVAVDFCLPAVLLNAFTSAQYDLRSVIIPLVMFVACIAGWALGRLLGRMLKFRSRFVPYLTTGFEAGMLGYTLYGMLYGAENAASFALVDLGQVLFVFTMYKALLSSESVGKVDPRMLLREMLTSPILWSIAAGLLLGATGLYSALKPSGISGLLDACTGFLSAPTSVLILLSVGYDLVWKEIRWRETFSVVLLRFGIMLALMAATLALVTGLFGRNPALSGAIIMMFLLPPPYVLPVFADDPDQRAFVSSAISVSTLLTIAAFAVLSAF